MQKIRLALASAALVLGVATVSHAQGAEPQGGRGRGGAAMMQQMMMKDITLSADQQAKFDAIQQKYQTRRDSMMAALRDGSGDRQAMRGQVRDMMKSQSDEIRAILTDDQKKSFDRNLADMEARRQEMQQNRPAGSPPPTR